MTGPRIRVNLALQGGGAHGVFTWGAIERLLDDDGIEVAAISGSSAGALNGAALKTGLVRGGREGARAELARLWSVVGAPVGPAVSDWVSRVSPDSAVMAALLEISPLWQALDAATRILSPNATGAFIQNPLARMIGALDYAALGSGDGPELHVSATNVRTGKIRVFKDEGIDAAALLATTCLPTLFPTVEIADPATGRVEAYWDGGYSGNPALFPLYGPHLPDDVLIVSINPFVREAVPRGPMQVANRINEISFNGSLLGELRAIAFVQRLIGAGAVERGRMKHVNVHMIGDDDLMDDLNVATKTVPVPAILARLREAGRRACDRFLAAHRDDLGQRGTLDLAAMLS